MYDWLYPLLIMDVLFPTMVATGYRYIPLVLLLAQHVEEDENYSIPINTYIYSAYTILELIGHSIRITVWVVSSTHNTIAVLFYLFILYLVVNSTDFACVWHFNRFLLMLTSLEFTVVPWHKTQYK